MTKKGRRVGLLAAAGAAALIGLALPRSAVAAAPVLSNVVHKDRHPTASIAAPFADSVTIYVASKPDRATDGSFLTENIETLDSLTDSEIQLGQWEYESRLDPGTYYLMARASPDFDACYIFDAGSYRPECADGYSEVVTLTIPKPRPVFRATVTTYRFLRQVELRLTVPQWGEATRYRVCWQLADKRNRCIAGRLDAYSWSNAADDRLTASTQGMAKLTTFRWQVGGRTVATKRVRVR